MKLALLNTVLLAEDYARLRDWWIRAIGLELAKEWSEDFHYAELVHDGRYVVGIADAAEMRAEPRTPRNNAALPQLQTDDVGGLLERVAKHGGTVVHGPARDAREGIWYGAFQDIEGNQVWVVSFGAGALDDVGS